jgi:hypothetical protein
VRVGVHHLDRAVEPEVPLAVGEVEQHRCRRSLIGRFGRLISDDLTGLVVGLPP